MPRTLRRLAPIVAAGLMLSVVPVQTAGAQDTTDDACRLYGLIVNADGTCIYPTVPTADVPLVSGSFAEGDWFAVTDPSGDVRSPDGNLFPRPTADITQAWWRVGKLRGPLARDLRGRDAIAANDTNLNTRDRYLQLVIRVVGDTIGPKPTKDTLLISVATDRNGKPADNEAATTGAPFSDGVGTDTTHQAGQFSTGVFGAGSGKLNGNGEYAGFYNTGSGVWMDVEPDSQSYTLLIPMRNMGDTFRIFTRATDGELPIADLVGSPLDANGFLNVDGIAGPADGCVELFQVDPALVGDRTSPAAFQIRLGGPPQDTPLFLDMDLFRGNKEVSLDPIPGVVDGEGFKFDFTVSREGTYRMDRFQLLGDLNGDGIPEALPATGRSLSGGLDLQGLDRMLANRWAAQADARGHLLGSLNCARNLLWLGTDNACATIGDAPDDFDYEIWDQYVLRRELADSLGLPDASLTPGGDDVFSTCTLTDAAGAPVFAVNWFRHPVSVEQAEEIALDLERTGCKLSSLTTTNSALLAWQRSCGGEQPSESVFATDRETGYAFFAQTPRTDPSFGALAADLLPRFEFAFIDELDVGVGEAGFVVDWDGDGVPDGQDRHPVNAHDS